MKLLIKICFKIFGKRSYYIPFINNIIYSNSKLKSDILNNEKILKKFDINIKDLKKKLSKFNIDYFAHDISWHYFIFCGFSLKKNNLNILEIGTSEGNFTNFLSKIFISSKITTIDLPVKQLRELNKQMSNLQFEFFIKKKKFNLNRTNIEYIEMNSKDLLKNFNENTFDLIWIDGDHKAPQVGQDIDSSLKIIKDKGIVCCDDIVMNEYITNYVDSDSYKHLLKKNNLENYFLTKRVRRSNYDSKKYVSVSVIQKNI